MAEETIEEKVDCVPVKTVRDLILYKMDRTFAVLGIILIGTWAIAKGTEMTGPAIQITTGAITALATYIGGRTGNK